VTKLTPKQRQLLGLLRDGLDQTAIADQLRVTKQAVSKQVQSLGWKVFSSGEDGLRAALTRA
jgi:DNA-binding NarL/FixJ family response regulator